jgi:hypothetical protein
MGYFTPHVVLRNLAASPQTATATVEYPSAPGWDSTEGRTNAAAGSATSGAAASPRATPDPSKLTQQPDFKKNKIPAAATDGSVGWIRIDNVPVMGRLAVIARHGGVASSFDCCVCICPAYYTEYMEMTSAPVCPIGVGATSQQGAQAQFQVECSQSTYYQDETDVSSWSSTNPAVFTLNSTTALLTAVGGGTADASSQGPSECSQWQSLSPGSCTCNNYVSADGGAGCGVRVPWSLKVINAPVPVISLSKYVTGCLDSDYGIAIAVHYQLLDQNGQVMSTASG